MSGRAGRTGYDDVGEAILISTKSNESRLRKLLQADLPSLSGILSYGGHEYVAEEMLLESIACKLTEVPKVRLRMQGFCLCNPI
jgi:replicative superfamily II helicase